MQYFRTRLRPGATEWLPRHGGGDAVRWRSALVLGLWLAVGLAGCDNNLAQKANEPTPSDRRAEAPTSPPPTAGSGPTTGAPPPGKAAPSPPAPPSAPPSPGPAPRSLAPSEPAPTRGAARDAPKEAWDFVPVFFGTDRARDTSVTKRLAYGTERARRLELGHAIVTVPLAHKVPNVERPWAITVFGYTIYEQAEDPKEHFTIKEIGHLEPRAFERLVRERLAKSKNFKNRGLLFVHGYNTTFDFALYRTAQIAYDMKFDGAPFMYSWPSGGGVLEYTRDRERAEQAERHLREFIEGVVATSGVESLSIIAHSMGNQPVLRVLRELRASARTAIRIDQVILAAPDVDRDWFEDISSQIRGIGNGITLYASANDRALDASRRLWGSPRAGDVPRGGPVVVGGVDTIDVTSVSTDVFGLNHSSYASNRALLDDVERLLRTGMRPPEARYDRMKRITSPKGPFWRYP